MARQELHTDTLKTEQLPPIGDPDAYDGDVVLVDPALATKEYAAALAFMEEPVRIRIEPSVEENAASAFPFWCNGEGAEIFINGRWFKATYLPTGQELIVKRKIVEVIARAKVNTVRSNGKEQNRDGLNGDYQRITTPSYSFTVMEDTPRGHAWLTEMRRRNY